MKLKSHYFSHILTSLIERPAWAFLFATMAFWLVVLISLLKTGFSAEISVLVQTGDSVHLDIRTQELPEFDLLSWENDKSKNIVRFIHASKTVKPYSSYKNRVDFNDETFSLTLKNMQKTDSGLYTAKTIGELNKNIITYRVSVIDAVEAPVLTVNSSWSSPDPCSFTCKGSNIIIGSIYNSSSCSPEEESSSGNYTLRLNCSGDYIMCIYSNPVSWKTDRKKVNDLCTIEPETRKNSMNSSWFILFICLLTTGMLVSVIGWCLYKRKKGAQEDGCTVYDQVGAQEMQKTNSHTYDVPERVQDHTHEETEDN